MDFYKSLKTQLKRKGINIINIDYYNNIENWKQWYNGFVPSFHKYSVKLSDGTNVEKERLTMNMPKKVCEDRTKLIWSENVKINLDNGTNTKKLWEILDSKKNNISIMMPKMLEMGYATGTTAFTEYKDKDGDVIIEYITDAMNIVPYAYDNFNITGMCVIKRFVEEEKNTKVYYTHVTYHEYKDGTYIKYNELYRAKTDNEIGKEISFEEKFPNVQNPVEYNDVEVPHFQIFKPNIANNYDSEIPMGISVLANSIDRFKAIDIKYDSFNNEFISGKKRILVDKSSLKSSPQVDANGNVHQVMYFDKNDETYVAINGMENQPVKEIDFNLREQEHVNSINNELSWLGANCGFGESYYSLSGSKLKTATEVMSEDTEAYRTKNADEIVLKDCIYDLIRAVCYLSGIDYKEITIETDYSRFKNETAEQQRYEREVNMGVLSKVEYRMKVYNEDEETAKQKIAEIKSNDPSIQDLVG